jgi:putative ABC transport system permease protein
MIIKLAWRNIWRNRRRTLITSASILFAVFFATVMESLQQGAWNHMINNVVNFYYGYAQIQGKGYWGDQTIDKAFPFDEQLALIAERSPYIHEALPRIESFALAAAENTTLGVMVVGIDPARENTLTNLAGRVSRGAYLQHDDQAALIAEGIAERLGLEVGDTLVLISQGYRGANAAGKYLVKGLVHFGSPDLNRRMVFLPLAEAQWFYAAEGLVTSVALKIPTQRDIAPALSAVRANLDETQYDVLDWKQLLPELVEAKNFDSAGNIVVYFILYLVIAFGIFGTILMMTKERTYEFGVLTAIGMKRRLLSLTVTIEVLLLGLLGAAAGMVASLPVVWYLYWRPLRFSGDFAGLLEKFGFEPIFPTTIDIRIFLAQAAAVFLITALLSIYPWVKIFRLRPVEAMRD